MFEIDGVELEVTDDGLEAIADKALAQQTGARGLRTVLEQVLLDTMFEIPARSDIRKCIVTADTITSDQRPLLLTASDAEIFSDESKSA